MGDAERKPVPGGLSTGLGRAAVADPAANQWGARIVAVPGSRAEGVDSLVWFADANAMVSTMSVEIPLWNVDASNEEDTYRAQQLAGLGQRIVSGGGAGEETFKFTIPAVKHLLQQDADIRWMGSLDDLIGGDDPAAIEIRAEFRGGDGTDPIADGERDAFVQFLRERAA
jgi:hypothetical protein